jgi:uncharacterized protein
VIVVDANLLIYAHNSASDHFAKSHDWLEHALSGTDSIGLPWAVIHAFLRLTTGKVVLPRPLDTNTATSIVDDWLALPTVTIVEPGRGYWPIFREFCGRRRSAERWFPMRISRR